MHAFTDSRGQRWHVPLDVALVERVRDEVEIDLLDSTSVPRLLQADPVLIWRVLCVLLADRLAPAELSPRLKGEAVRAAAHAIVEAITSFFRRPWVTGPTTATRVTRRSPDLWSAAIGSPVRSGSTRCSRASPLAS